MLTDIFAHRYTNIVLRESFEEHDRRLIVQLFRLLEEQVCPYWKDGHPTDAGKKFWSRLNKLLSMELGLSSLSDEWYRVPNNVTRKAEVTICKDWMLVSPPKEAERVDTYIKERLSLIELGFREREKQLREQSLSKQGDSPALRPSNAAAGTSGAEFFTATLKAIVAFSNTGFKGAVEELNERLRRAGYPLHYHNGFLQFSEDKVIETVVEEPFWKLVAAPEWLNVDAHIKQAIDLRDTGGPDPSLYAAKALESTIKIISGEKGWTQGGEKGAHSFIDNLVSKGNGRFVEVWEAEQLKAFFTNVRNPLGHGPGGEPMPGLTRPQTDWAIAFCMAWIRSLIARR